MREIKYRVFDSRTNQMSRDFVFINFITKTMGFYAINSLGEKKIFERDMDNFPIMQYTGLKDKNNVEIFEGDIIRSHNSRQGEKIEDYEVIYVGSGFCIKSLKENEIHNKGTLYSFALYSDNIDFLKDDYIIGNIYENQELLN